MELNCISIEFYFQAAKTSKPLYLNLIYDINPLSLKIVNMLPEYMSLTHSNTDLPCEKAILRNFVSDGVKLTLMQTRNKIYFLV